MRDKIREKESQAESKQYFYFLICTSNSTLYRDIVESYPKTHVS